MKTTPHAPDAKHPVADGVLALKQLRDEIHLELHLGGMDAKDAWKKLEPRLHEVEHAARAASDASTAAINKLLHEFREFRATLKKPHPQ